MSLYQAPPETITVNGWEYPVDTDFRFWMEFQSIILSGGQEQERAERLAGFMDRLGLPSSREALDAMLTFYTAESKEKPVAGRPPRGGRGLKFLFDVIKQANLGEQDMRLVQEYIIKQIPQDDIAAELGLSRRTVHAHLKRSMSKMTEIAQKLYIKYT